MRILLIILFSLIPYSEKSSKKQKMIVNIKTNYHYVKAYKYNAEPSQCWGNARTFKDGTKVDTIKLKNYKLKVIALSHDLFKMGYKYGDSVMICSNNKFINGKWVIKDLMNKRHKMSIDILLPINDKTGFGSAYLAIRKL